IRGGSAPRAPQTFMVVDVTYDRTCRARVHPDESVRGVPAIEARIPSVGLLLSTTGCIVRVRRRRHPTLRLGDACQSAGERIVPIDEIERRLRNAPVPRPIERSGVVARPPLAETAPIARDIPERRISIRIEYAREPIGRVIAVAARLTGGRDLV